MIKLEDYTNENKTVFYTDDLEYKAILNYVNLKSPYIPDHPYRILLTGDSGSGKTNALLDLIYNRPDVDKTYLYAKDPYEAIYQIFK